MKLNGTSKEQNNIDRKNQSELQSKLAEIRNQIDRDADIVRVNKKLEK